MVVETAHILNGRFGWIKTNQDKKIYFTLRTAALNLICQYAVMAMEITDKEIFCVPLNDILRFVQTFSFPKMTTKIKERLVILTNIGDFWAANLCAYDNYDLRMRLSFNLW